MAEDLGKVLELQLEGLRLDSGKHVHRRERDLKWSLEKRGRSPCGL